MKSSKNKYDEELQQTVSHIISSIKANVHIFASRSETKNQFFVEQNFTSYRNDRLKDKFNIY